MNDTQVHDSEAAIVLVGASAALDTIAEGLVTLHDHWRVLEGSAPIVTWLERMIADAGWWSGRLLAEVARGDPT